MLKRILIPLDPSPYTDNAIQLGCLMGKQLGAELTGMVILDIPGIEKSIGPIPLGGMYYADKLEAQKEAEAQKHIDGLLDKFQKICSAAGVKHKLAQVQGSPSDQIIKESHFYDSLLIGMRTFFHFESQDRDGDSLEKILDHAITPIYAVPKVLNIPVEGVDKIRVCIALNDSLPAARAVQRFAQLAMPEMMQVTLLTSNENAAEGERLLHQAEAYLQVHGFNNLTMVCTDQAIIEAIDEQYLDTQHVFVVGAHSKHGLFDFALGSLTRHLLQAGRRPVLIG
ncbi:MAG: universal stress protein [FCB group bacterium]|nr:universal stress protein [FCB group bacterium]